jgi:hypothetical protein
MKHPPINYCTDRNFQYHFRWILLGILPELDKDREAQLNPVLINILLISTTMFVLCYYSICKIKKGDEMKLTPPTKNVFWLSTVVAAVGLVASFVAVPFVSAYAFWFVVVGFVLLWLGNAMKGF